MREIYFGLIAAVGTAFLYLSGYGYVYGYYKFYGISVNELELGFQETLVKSFFVFWRLLTPPDPSGILIAEKILIAGLFTVLHFFLLIRIFSELREHLHLKTNPWTSSLVVLTVTYAIIFAVSSSFVGGWVASEKLRSLPSAEILGGNFPKEVVSLIDQQDWYLYHLETTSNTHFLLLRKSRTDFRWLLRFPRSNEVIVRQFQQ